MLPSKCGLAGDVVAICLRHGDADPRALVAVGPSPDGLAAAARDGQLTATGPLSVGVPGAPAGYAALSELANLPLEHLVRPAIEIAGDGFIWAGINHLLSVESKDLVEFNNSAPNSFFPEGRPIAQHSVVRLPGLAKLLSEFATRGGAVFTSAIGEEVAAYVASLGGVLHPEDFAAARAEWSDCPRIENEGRTVWATPAPTQGAPLLEALSGRLAGATGGVIWDRVQDGLAARARLHDGSGTSIVSAADSDGNVAVVIHSNSFPRFGSGLVVSEYDLILSNRAGRGFSNEPGHPNFPAPGKRPATTLHAWGVDDGAGRPALLGGTPGGENQLIWNTQLLAQLLGGESDPGMLVVAPRWEIGPSGGVTVEEGLDQVSLAELEERAGPLDRIPRWGLHSAFQVISVPRAGEAIAGAVDPRTGGAAVPV
jgi:gamma-glutamyltranspeptidase/glutathione hydrolase